MLRGIRRFISAPVFPGDEDKTIAAAMAHFGILFGLVANLIHIPILFLAGDPAPRSLLFPLAVIVGLLLNHRLVQLGHVRGSSAMFLVVAWALLAGANLTAGGVEAPGFVIHLVFILCAGFIFGGRGAFLAAGFSSLLGVVFLVLEREGRLPPLQVNNTPARHAILLTATFFTVAAILSMMMKRLRATIADGRRELLVRQQAEQRLEQHQAELEETVRVRTRTLEQTNDALLREVDDRRRAEEALRQEKEFIAHVMETSPVGIAVSDAKGGFSFVNATAQRVLRRSREEIARLGCTSPEWGFTDHHGRPLPATELPFLVAAATGKQVRNAPIAVQTPEGSRVLLTVNVVPFGDDREPQRRFVVTLEDVTERQRIEQEVHRAQKLESVGVLAGGIAHDFNNLLTGIMGNISLAQIDAPEGSQIAEALEEAEKASLQAGELTRQLLTFSRGGAPVKRPLAVAETVSNAVQFALRGTNVRGVFTIPADLWAVDADQGQLNQVIHNLGINACQAMPDGGTVDVQAANVRLGDASGVPLPSGRYVVITVTDHGVGIPAATLERIFDPFFTTKKEGTGLGLAVVHSIVRNHGGHIGVTSEEGRGSTFTVYLPASESVPLAAANPPRVRSGLGRVLIMDDDPSVRSVSARMLASMGYEVHTAAEGAEVVATYRAARAAGQRFDAVILDLTIPGGMGGTEALRHLREIDPDVRALVSSGYSNDPVMSNYLEHGFCNVIAKPYRLGELSRVMSEVFGPRGKNG